MLPRKRERRSEPAAIVTSQKHGPALGRGDLGAQAVQTGLGGPAQGHTHHDRRGSYLGVTDLAGEDRPSAERVGCCIADDVNQSLI